MGLKEQIIQEYLSSGLSYQKLSVKHGIGVMVICKWVKSYQSLHNLPRTDQQRKHYLDPMAQKKTKKDQASIEDDLLRKIAELEKKVAQQNMKIVVLDTLINVAEKQLNVNIRKKPGTQQSKK